MAEYAPAAIRGLYNLIKAGLPSAEMSGVVGDTAHTYGYHRCRNVVPGGDYSRQHSLDQQGDGWAASALDVKLPPDQMRAVTARLISAAKAGDPRLRALREFCGTTDGVRTHGFDLSTGRESLGEWDDSHLWHVHLSVYRALRQRRRCPRPHRGRDDRWPRNTAEPGAETDCCRSFRVAAAGRPLLRPDHRPGRMPRRNQCRRTRLGAADPAAPAGSWLRAQDSRLG